MPCNGTGNRVNGDEGDRYGKDGNGNVPIGRSYRGEYQLISTRRPPGVYRPQGWVILPHGSHTKRRTMTEGYLNQRMPRSNTVAMNQNYVTKVLNNPRTPRENRDEVIAYVLKHPDKFIPLPEDPDDLELTEFARKRNGNAVHGFVQGIRRKYRSLFRWPRGGDATVRFRRSVPGEYLQP